MAVIFIQGLGAQALDVGDAVDVADGVAGHHRLQRRDRNTIEMGLHALAVGTEPAAARRIVDHPGAAVDVADGHHHVAGDVDQVADLQVGDGAVAHRLAVLAGERQAIQRRADRLRAGIARQQHAEAAVDLGDETAAVAGVVVVAPAVALAEELEGLLQQQARGQRQVVGGGVLRARQQRRHQLQRPSASRTGNCTTHEACACWPFTGSAAGQSASTGRRTPMSSCRRETRGSSGV
jgi:hypothetical protein